MRVPVSTAPAAKRLNASVSCVTGSMATKSRPAGANTTSRSHAASAVMVVRKARDASIASLRRRVHEYKGVPLIVTYHPAYLLRNLPDKAKAWEDLCFAVATMQRLQSGTIGPT